MDDKFSPDIISTHVYIKSIKMLLLHAWSEVIRQNFKDIPEITSAADIFSFILCSVWIVFVYIAFITVDSRYSLTL